MRTDVRIRCLIAVLAFLAVAPGWAQEHAVTSNGTIHSIDVVPWGHGPEGGGGATAGAALQHVRHLPDGTRETRILPGTDDYTLDREPSLDLCPDSGNPVVAWSRVAKRGQHEILIARFEQDAWTAPQILYAGGTPDAAPRIRIARRHLHVVWEQDVEGAAPRRLRMLLDRSTLETVQGPDDLPLGTPQDGADSSGNTEPGDDLSHFASLVPSELPDGNATIVVWGIRDEPVPITYMRSIAAPPEVESARSVEAQWLEGRLVVWFVSGSRFYHTRRIERDGAWTDLQRIDLVGAMTAAEAHQMVQSMLRREALDSYED